MLLAGCGTAPPLRRAAIEYTRTVVRDSTLNDEAPIPSRWLELARANLEESATHHVALLNVGEDALIARLHLIRAARETIDIQTYIWSGDASGRLVLDELLRAARRGVRVRLLIDQIGARIPLPDLARYAVAHENLDIRIYRPVYDQARLSAGQVAGILPFRLNEINRRMHNKTFIVDGSAGIVGGRNVEDVYFDLSTAFNFRDQEILVLGPCVDDMLRSFETYWNSRFVKPTTTLDDVAVTLYRARDSEPATLPSPPVSAPLQRFLARASVDCPTSDGDRLRLYRTGEVAFLADWPNRDPLPEPAFGMDVTQGLLDLVAEATGSVLFQTPYLVLTSSSMNLLKRLRKARPEMEIVFSTNSLAAADHFYVYAISTRQRGRLLRAVRARIYEFRPYPADILAMAPRYREILAADAGVDDATRFGFVPIEGEGPRISIHSKVLVVDGRTAVVGTHNFDPRSKRLNTECVVIVRDASFAATLERNIRLDIDPGNSWAFAVRPVVFPVLGHLSVFVEGISRRLPVGDVYPIRHTACFAPRNGMAPVTSTDPRFYDHYRDVGPFPQVSLSWLELRTRLYSALFGWTTPLM